MDIKNLIFLTLLFSSIESFGDGKFVIGNYHAGLFSTFIAALTHLRYCNLKNLTPTIYWDSNICDLYFNPQGHNGAINNFWEYYFEPVSNLQALSDDVIHATYPDVEDNFLLPDYPYISAEQRQESYQIIQKYIRIKQPILDKIAEFYNLHFMDKFTIGIHYRGTDKWGEVKRVDMQSVIHAANSVANSTEKRVQFFVATDVQSFLDFAKAHLNGPVIFYDSFRSSNNHPVHHRKPSQSQVGEEAVIDMMLLSKCNYLIRTPSNLSVVALLVNPDIPEQFIWNGRNIFKTEED